MGRHRIEIEFDADTTEAAEDFHWWIACLTDTVALKGRIDEAEVSITPVTPT